MPYKTYYNKLVDAIVYDGEALPERMSRAELVELALALLDQAHVDVNPLIETLTHPSEAWIADKWQIVDVYDLGPLQ